MLDDLSKVEFTMLFGDVDQIIGDPLIIDIPEQTNEKVKIDNIKINDTKSEIYIYKNTTSVPIYDDNSIEAKSIEKEEKEFSFEIDSYENNILNNVNNIILQGDYYDIKAKENANEFKQEMENYFKEKNIQFEIKELKSGEIVTK